MTRPDGSRGLRYNFHPGQLRAWASAKRDVVVLAGTQSGKTAFGPLWLHREIQLRGPGDYLVVTPTYKLLNLKALPEFLALFGRRRLGLGDYSGQGKVFTSHDGGTRVLFGHAQDPDSLESATAKAAWLDEAGQKKFRLGSLEAINRRLSIHRGRKLITTTPYDLGWLKQRYWDRWEASGCAHPEFDLIRFDSTLNPTFSREEFEKARRELPGWKFDLFYRAIFTRPPGLIYDCFGPRNRCPRFKIPDVWPRFLGLDFGGQNTAAVHVAENPADGKLYVYREYGPEGGKTAAAHAAALLKAEGGRVPIAAGGAKSEQQWRDEFAAGGLPVAEPDVADVEVGINRVYGALATGRLIVFDDLAGLLDELGSYSRELDDAGNPTEDIEDKSDYHRLDALRYIVPSAVAVE